MAGELPGASYRLKSSMRKHFASDPLGQVSKVRAHEIWEGEGRPHGRNRKHWYVIAGI